MSDPTLWQCVRCGLQFLWEGTPDECPRCGLRHGIPTRIILGTMDVTKAALQSYGEREGLLKPEVRVGLSVVNLADRCKHGYISFLICPDCSGKSTRFA